MRFNRDRWSEREDVLCILAHALAAVDPTEPCTPAIRHALREAARGGRHGKRFMFCDYDRSLRFGDWQTAEDHLLRTARARHGAALEYRLAGNADYEDCASRSYVFNLLLDAVLYAPGDNVNGWRIKALCRDALSAFTQQHVAGWDAVPQSSSTEAVAS